MKFRVHYGDGTHLDVDAETPVAARKIAAEQRAGVVSKVKVVKEDKNGC